MGKSADQFWNSVPFEQLNLQQWEALCDHCGKCCVHRLEDERTRKIHYTNVACRFLDPTDCRCNTYRNRLSAVPECISVTRELLRDNPGWLPGSCAYRRVAEGKQLPRWHPLVSGNPLTVIESGNSMVGRVVSELDIMDLRHHIVDWAD
ncbi:MAG: YcgN family cysteine cluster protein [Gammaproteobacteria bacterium]|nr:YcgN family cysteine cluster protein [Gammaproteobacteria bacterium]